MYRNLLDESPPSETSNNSGPGLPLIADAPKKTTKPNGHYTKQADTKDAARRRKNSECGASAMSHSTPGGAYYNYRFAYSCLFFLVLTNECNYKCYIALDQRRPTKRKASH